MGDLTFIVVLFAVVVEGKRLVDLEAVEYVVLLDSLGSAG
jgi:hypothetical protein